MRPRVRSDRTRDLADRHGLETNVASTIANHPGLNLEKSNTASLVDCDFNATDRFGKSLTIELKTRRQTYSPTWCALKPDTDPADLFIIDELAVRKIVTCAPHAYLLIADLANPLQRWIVFSTGDLLVIDRARVTRPIVTTRGETMHKGKWLIDLNDAPVVEHNLSDALDQLLLLTRTVDACWHRIEPWPTNLRHRAAA